MGPTLHTINSIIHVAFGSAALAGGLVALGAVKGSKWHIRGGKLFVWTMLFVVLTSTFVLFNEFLPLVIVMALAELYLIPSAILSVHRRREALKAWNWPLTALAGLLAVFAAVQFVRFNLASDQLFLGPGVLAVMFGFLFYQDWVMLRRPLSHRNCWLRRHLVRMILAFTFAVMALVRIGLNFGLSLEASVVVPLVIAAGAILVIYRWYPVPDVGTGVPMSRHASNDRDTHDLKRPIGDPD